MSVIVTVALSLTLAQASSADATADTTVTASAMPETTSAEPPARFGFDRVDILSEAPGTFLHYDVPVFGTDPTVKAVRFLEQVTVFLKMPVRGLSVGLSLGTQSLWYEHRLTGGLYGTAALQTRLLFPTGANVGLAYRMGILRIGASVSMTTSGSWAAPSVFVPALLPVLGIGIGTP